MGAQPAAATGRMHVLGPGGANPPPSIYGPMPHLAGAAIVPLAFMGRCSLKEPQDPTLSIPRQLTAVRAALPPNAVIVRYHWEVVSGRKDSVEDRAAKSAHAQFDVPVPRHGSIADLLALAARP